MAGRITRPLRWNGKPYSGINLISLWGESVLKGYSAPYLDDLQAGFGVGWLCPQGEHGSLVVYADRHLGGKSARSSAEAE